MLASSRFGSLAYRPNVRVDAHLVSSVLFVPMRYVLASSSIFALIAGVFAQNTEPRRIQVNDVELHYIERGQGEAVSEGQ